MINTVLNVDDICQDCPYFSIETNHTTNYDSMHMIYMIYISCEHRDICDYLRKHNIEKGGGKKVSKSLCHDCIHNCTDHKNNICANHKGIWCNAEYGRVINKKVKGCENYARKENKK